MTKRITARLAMLLAATALVGGGVAEAQLKAIRTATSISPAERKQGDEAHPQLLAEFGGAYAGPQAAYVNRIGQNIAVQSGLSHSPSDFTVTLLNSPVNNAFAIPPMDPITQIDPKKLAKVNETNVFAPLRLSALFADALAESKGSIIMLNSCVAFSSQPEYAGYKLSKGALEHLASSLATELGPRGIRVNSVAPSYIYEDVNRGYFDFLAAVESKTHDEVYAEKAAPTDLKRLASSEEVARATLFLASDLASAVTGQMLTVDCGEFHD